MNTRQLELYNNLMAISSSSRSESAFYYVDQDVISEKNPEKYQGWKYRIFGYMLASYTDFLQQDALWCRGTMFLINEKQEPQELTCLPMKKFFNLGETPIGMVSDRILNEDVLITEKRDGSLMSTYVDIDGNLKLKSKMSIKSDHCIEAMKLLDMDRYKGLKEYLNNVITRSIVVYENLLHADMTVDLEWTSPNNRIVLGYDADELMILSSQHLHDVCSVSIDTNRWFVKTFRDKNVLKENKEGIEGYVVELKDGLRVKIKTDWYCLLHKNKEKISTPCNLYELCLNEQADDLIALFAGDDITIQQIKDMQTRAKTDYYKLKNNCDAFYYSNKELDRKSYAIKGQEVLTTSEFGLAMALYLGKEPDYIKILIKNFI